MNRVAITIGLLLLLGMSESPARAAGDRVGWMASRLESGQDILDWELALTQFVRQSDPRVLPTLMKLLGSDRAVSRAETAGVMWHYDNKEVRERLVELTQDTDSSVRIEAAKSLCLMKYSASLEILAGGLRHEEPAVRARGFRALAAVGGEEARKTVEAVRPYRTPTDAVWAAFALHAFGVDPDGQIAQLRRVLISLPRSATLSGKTDPTAEDLQRAVEAGRAGLENRQAAAEALSRIGSEPALAVLVEGTADRAALDAGVGASRLLPRHHDMAALACATALGSAEVLVRLGCARELARLRLRTDEARESVARALGQAFDDPSRLVRLAAMRAGARLRLTACRQRLVAALQHSDPETRAGAARALGDLGDEDAVEPLLRSLQAESNGSARRAIYEGLARLRSPRVVEPLFARLKQLYRDGRSSARAAEELPPCIEALASGGEVAAEKVLRLLPKMDGDRRRLLVEVLARSGSELAIDFFLDKLRESPPEPDSPEVRFFDSLDERFVPRLEQLISGETAMWIRVIMARSLYRLGKVEFGRGLLWGLKNSDPYLRRLSAALMAGLHFSAATEPLVGLLADEPDTAWYAARALLGQGSAEAVAGLLGTLDNSSLRQRKMPPIDVFWEGARSARHPFAKEVDNDRVWVLFAEDRMGRKFDLFLTWSADGRSWKPPIFTGLTSFADPEGQVPPPTFSLKVRSRDITIAHTWTFAQANDPRNPKFKTLQRVFKYKLQDLYRDKDGDGLTDLEERDLGTSPQRTDTDGDGLEDAEDKNPLARPVQSTRDEDVLALLAFSHVYWNTTAIPRGARLLLVEEGRRTVPELPTFRWLVLHMKPEVQHAVWRNTGAGYPSVLFGLSRIQDGGRRAVQPLLVRKGPGDEEAIDVTLARRGGQWVVTGSHRAD